MNTTPRKQVDEALVLRGKSSHSVSEDIWILDVRWKGQWFWNGTSVIQYRISNIGHIWFMTFAVVY